MLRYGIYILSRNLCIAAMAALLNSMVKQDVYGFDFSGRYQPIRSLYFDVDVNYAHGRAIDEAKGEDYIPLAPIWTSTGGITYINKNGFNGSFRYRYVGDRPGNEDYSLTAVGYFITDAVIKLYKAKI